MAPPKGTLKSRINVTIKQAGAGLAEEKELDYRTLVMGDFSNKPMGSQGELRDRKPMKIEKANDFTTVLKNAGIKFDFQVDSKLSKTPGAKIPVQFEVKEMKDFTPDEIINKIEPLKEIVAARNLLRELRTAVVKNPKIGPILTDVVKNPEARDEVMGSLNSLMSKLQA